MFRLSLIFVVVFLCALSTKAQVKPWYKPTRIGFMYGYGEHGGILIKDGDFYYSSHLFKVQLYYPIKNGKLSLMLELEPTIGVANHQLLNVNFIKSWLDNYLVKQAVFSESRALFEYILNINLLTIYKVSDNFQIYVTGGIGPMFMSQETERLAKGFAFSETVGLGIITKISDTLNLNIRHNFRHLSNAELRQPNSGINVAILAIGFNIDL